VATTSLDSAATACHSRFGTGRADPESLQDFLCRLQRRGRAVDLEPHCAATDCQRVNQVRQPVDVVDVVVGKHEAAQPVHGDPQACQLVHYPAGAIHQRGAVGCHDQERRRIPPGRG